MTSTSHLRTGTVLIIVVVIVMLLSLVAYKFMLSMQTEHVAVALGGDRIQARQSAQSALDLMTLILKKSRSARDEMGGLSDNPAYFAGDTTAFTDTTSAEVTNVANQQPPFGLIAYALKSGSNDEERDGSSPRLTQSQRTGDSMLVPPTRYGAINESKKLHLLKVLEWEVENPGSGIAALMSLPGMDQETAESLLDWIDSDDEPRAGGAEGEFYATLTRPIAPRNALPVEIAELLFVKGVTTQRLFGERSHMPISSPGINSTSNPNTAPVPNSPYRDTDELRTTPSTTEPPGPWVDYLTVYSAERNESYTGQPRIYLNAEDLQELHSGLSSRISKEWADFIVLYRQFGPNSTTRDQGSVPDRQQEEDVPITISFEISPEFTIENPLDLIGVSVTIPAEDEDSEDQTVQSPISAESITVQNDIAQLLDLVTIIPEQRIIGRININEAPVEVLAALPGLSEETIDSIVSARDRPGDETNTRVHPIWLVTAGLVDLQTLRPLLPHITCGGDVYRAEVWGRADQRTAMVRFETVLDASTKDCRPVYYRELDAPNDEIKILSAEEYASLGIAARTQDRTTSF